jgi:hypothetical protein
VQKESENILCCNGGDAGTGASKCADQVSSLHKSYVNEELYRRVTDKAFKGWQILYLIPDAAHKQLNDWSS